MRKVVLSNGPLCTACKANGRVTIATIVDHRTALMNGGTNDYDNLHGLCDDCHAIKTEADKGRKPKQQIGEDGWPIT